MAGISATLSVLFTFRVKNALVQNADTGIFLRKHDAIITAYK